MSRISIYIYLFLLIGLDLGIKKIVSNILIPFEVVDFIPFINLYLTFNSGIAFSMFDFGVGVSSYILLIIGILIVTFLFNQLFEEDRKDAQISYILIIGGALGNIIDRAIDGVVTDFLHLYISNFSFFIFNPADAFITIGALLLIYSEFRKGFNGQKSNN